MNPGDTAWVLASAALVMLMTPGLAFFYGGMVRSKSVLNMLMMNFITLGVVGVLWLLYGYSMSFGSEGGRRLRRPACTTPCSRNTVGTLAGPKGRPDTDAVVRDVPADVRGHHARADLRLHRRPDQVLGLGAVRRRLGDRRVLPGRALGVRLQRLHRLRTRSAAGSPTSSRRSTSPVAPRSTSTPAAAGLALALVLGKRKGWPRSTPRPHNVPFVLLGAALLWFGWYGFNAGSALAAGDLASIAFTTTTVATAAGAARLAGRRADQGRQADHPGRRLRRRRRSGRDHPGVRLRRPDGRAGDRHRRGRDLRHGHRPEVPVRLRRLPRRGRRAPRRRHRRHPADRLLRHRLGELRRRERPVLRRRAQPVVAAGGRRRARCWRTRSSSRSSSAGSSRRRSASGSATRPRSIGIDEARTRRDRVRVHRHRPAARSALAPEHEPGPPPLRQQ